MKRKMLEEMNLTSEQIDKIMNENGNDINREQSKYAELKTENENLKKNISERDDQLKELKKTAGDADAMKKKIEELQSINEQSQKKFDQEIKELKVNSIIDTALAKAGARNAKAVRALLDIDMDKISVDENGSLTGLDIDKQLQALQKAEDSGFMFKDSNQQAIMTGVTPAKNPNIETGSTGSSNFDKMTYTQIDQYMKTHPDTKL